MTLAWQADKSFSVSCRAGRVWRYPARLAPPCSTAAAARWSPLGSCQLQIRVLAWFGYSACSVPRGHMACGGVEEQKSLAGFCCCDTLPPSCDRVCWLAVHSGVDMWWLWRQDKGNLLTPGKNVESLTVGGLWLREVVKKIVHMCWLFLRDAAWSQ